MHRGTSTFIAFKLPSGIRVACGIVEIRAVIQPNTNYAGLSKTEHNIRSGSKVSIHALFKAIIGITGSSGG